MIASISRLKLQRYANPKRTGVLVVADFARDLPIEIVRMFMITAIDAGGMRGGHAHRQCAQVLISPGGGLEVQCDNGRERATFRLDDPADALLIPPGIWLDVAFESEHATLVVLCDRPYEEDDYLRDYDAFVQFRHDAGGQGPAER